MTLELHSFDTPNGRKISVALEELGLPYTVHVVDITQGEQHAPEFTRLSPNHKIPAILDPEGPGGQPLSVFESGAILMYLAEKTGRLLSTDPVQRVRTLEWLFWQVGGFGPMPGQVHHFAGLDNADDQRYGLQRYMTETRRLYSVMDAHLKGRAFFADDFSIADIAILGWAWRHEKHRVDLAGYPEVRRWYAAMMARPGVQRGFEVRLKR
jgi:GST-like protein